MKQLFAFAVAGLLSVGAWAQTDVTSTYITNPSFELDGAKTASNGALADITGWFQSDPTSSFNNTGFYDASTNLPTQGTVTVTPSDGDYLLYFRKGWAQNTYTFTTTNSKNLPAGVYSLSVDYKMVEGYDNTQNNNTSVTISAKNGEETLGSAEGKTKTNVSGSYAYTYLNTAAWSTVTASFTLSEATDVNIVISLKAGGQRRSDFVIDNVKLFVLTPLEAAKQEALAALPANGDGFFTMSQATIEGFTQQINEATTIEAVNTIKGEITGWVAPALSGTWNIQNASAVYYLGIDEEKVVIAESPVAITFEKGTQGFYIKVGDKYINMKGNNNWTMSASDTPSTEWTFTLNDGKYTISGPKGLIGTDNVTPGSECYGDKGVGNNGTWIISEALSEEQIALAVAKNALQVALNGISVPTANIGTGVFQYNSEAIAAISEKVSTAQGVLDNESATKDQVDAQTAIISALSLPDLNAPAADQLYNIVVATSGHAKENNPVIIYLGSTGANNPTGYGLNANLAANTNLQQAFKFTKVEGNNYKISAQLAEGEVFLTNGSLNGSAAGWSNYQIQATTEAEKAMAFKIEASDVEGAFYIYNTVTNSTIACQAGGNIYTEAGNAYFKAVKTQNPSITVNTTAAGWGTVMLPFAQALPTDVKAYTCAEVGVDKTTLTLVEVDALKANKPYIIEGAWNATLEGDAQGTALTVTEGLLTGVYANTQVPVGSYVLLNEEEGVGFYKVVEGKQPTATANRAYLTAPAAVEVKEFFALGGSATAIRNIVKIQQGQTIYNLAGQRMNNVRKGVNIIGGKKVVIK